MPCVWRGQLQPHHCHEAEKALGSSIALMKTLVGVWTHIRVSRKQRRRNNIFCLFFFLLLCILSSSSKTWTYTHTGAFFITVGILTIITYTLITLPAITHHHHSPSSIPPLSLSPLLPQHYYHHNVTQISTKAIIRQ